MAPDPIPPSVRKLWDSWSIRSFVIASLSLQIFLLLFASFRRKTGNMSVHSLLWAAYLLADWVPTFTAGLIVKSLSTGKDAGLLALWAATLMRHLGGTSKLTAFSLEDNELWLRHFIGLIVQFTTALYVFLCTLPNPDNRLLIATIFALIGGFINYSMRVRSMYHATLDKFREEIVTQPYEVDNMYTELGLDKLFGEHRSEGLKGSEVATVAYHYFQIFKGLIVDVRYKPSDKEKSIHIFRDREGIISSDDAFAVISCELGYMYEVLYTSQDAEPTMLGFYSWAITFVSAAVVLGKFVRARKQDFHHVDVNISYALFIVPIVMDVMVFYAQEMRPKSPYPLMMSNERLDSSPDSMMMISEPRSRSYKIFGVALPEKFTPSRELYAWMIQIRFDIKPSIKRGVYNRPIMFRNWSESICSHNIISYSLKECPLTIPSPHGACRARIGKILQLPLAAVIKIVVFFRFIPDIVGLSEVIDRAIYVSKGPIPKKLWDFIFADLQDMSSKMGNGVAEFGSKARGSWCLQNSEPGCESCDHSELLVYVRGIEYHESILLWHIATELCYNTEEVERSDLMHNDDRDFSKVLSDYMLYLMVFQPGMMSSISGAFLRSCRKILEQTSIFLGGTHLGGGDGKLKKACISILDSKLSFKGEDGTSEESLLYRACSLAEKLKQVHAGHRWKIVFRVWLEMLAYAAGHCRGDIHARSLSRGGELLSVVWLLMAHLGIIGNDQENEAITDQWGHYA